jgi:hypothetical protein
MSPSIRAVDPAVVDPAAIHLPPTQPVDITELAAQSVNPQ